eukprot:gnl/TRDRNA2_/TRDRNA2_41419_c0_seq2.p2 gnl/TRDRNA2_/TRDRNA2_41419_c0~~gnl/TRDRNA2_/TRDRNA2_41419_c0_seq2.p2  ORF type:complete len:124 (-),score=13.76 gnl/TRDRNA2_/TRDRNA2_41419_c0_seq2:86-457(-)
MLAGAHRSWAAELVMVLWAVESRSRAETEDLLTSMQHLHNLPAAAVHNCEPRANGRSSYTKFKQTMELHHGSRAGKSQNFLEMQLQLHVSERLAHKDPIPCLVAGSWRRPAKSEPWQAAPEVN